MNPPWSAFRRGALSAVDWLVMWVICLAVVFLTSYIPGTISYLFWLLARAVFWSLFVLGILAIAHTLGWLP